MGQCMKDHPIEDVKEKLDDVQNLMEDGLVQALNQTLDTIQRNQSELNELFHSLKKLEKTRSEGDRQEAIQGITNFVENSK